MVAVQQKQEQLTFHELVQARNLVAIRKLIWLYFWLLIFEGAIRKWVIPQASLIMLVIRDPVLVYLYYRAFKAGIFPRNVFITFITVIGVLCMLAGFMVMDGPLKSWLTPAYGFRADFLHLPLIFLMPVVFDIRDVRRVGHFLLMIALPMGILMYLQFHAGADSFLNRGASEGAQQITFTRDTVRSSGTFSFVTGAISFFVLVTAFITDYFLSRKGHKLLFVLAAMPALGLAIVTSGSRTMLMSAAIVVVGSILIACVTQKQLVMRSLQMLGLIIVAWFALSQFSGFQSGLSAFNERVGGAMESEGGTSGVVQDRVLHNYTRPVEIFLDVPLLGVGLGMGTNVGSVLAYGTTYSGFADFENEAARNITESGPILGLFFVTLRVSLAFYLLIMSLKAAFKGNMLPAIIITTCFNGLMLVNFGQPSLQGFTVFSAGLCLCAMRDVEELEADPEGNPTSVAGDPAMSSAA